MLNINDAGIDAYLILGKCYLAKLQYDQALKAANNALCLASQDQPFALDALEILAETYLELEDYPNVIKNCKDFLKIDNNSPAIFEYMGLAYFRMQKYNEAIASFKLCLKNSDDDFQINGTHQNLSICLSFAGKFDEGLAVYRKVTKTFPFDECYENNNEECLILSSYAKTLAMNRNILDEIEAYNRILKHNPGKISILRLRGHAYYATNDPEYTEKAIQDMTQVLHSCPEDTGFLTGRAAMFVECQRYQEALVDLIKLSKLDPDNKVNAFNRGLVRHQLKMNDLAFADFTFHIENNNEPQAGAYIYRGYIHLSGNNYQEALQDFLKAKKMEKSLISKGGKLTKNLPTLLPLGFNKAYQGTQHFKKALKHVNMCLSIDVPAIKKETIYLDRAHINQKLGQLKEAIADLDVVLSSRPDDQQLVSRKLALEEQLLLSRLPAEKKYEEELPVYQTAEPATIPKNNSEDQELAKLKMEMQEAKEKDQKRQLEKSQERTAKKAEGSRRITPENAARGNRTQAKKI